MYFSISCIFLLTLPSPSIFLPFFLFLTKCSLLLLPKSFFPNIFLSFSHFYHFFLNFSVFYHFFKFFFSTSPIILHFTISSPVFYHHTLPCHLVTRSLTFFLHFFIYVRPRFRMFAQVPQRFALAVTYGTSEEFFLYKKMYNCYWG